MINLKNQLKEIDKAVVRFAIRMIFTSGTLRLDFEDGAKFIYGNGELPSLAIVPPSSFGILSILMNPSMRLGDSYVDKKWMISEGDLSDLIHLSELQKDSPYGKIYHYSRRYRGALFLGKQYLLTKYFTRKVRSHYNIDTDFYRKILGQSMAYSCAFFGSGISDLLSAQENKHRITTDRLDMHSPDLKVLDIGCGWGAYASYLDRTGVTCTFTGISISDSQISYCRDLFKDSNFFSFFRRDYINFAESNRNSYDRIVSIGMFEHVGLGHHAKFFDSVREMLVPGGIAVIHSIIRSEPGRVNEWMEKNIFPGGYAPSLSELTSAAERSKMRIRGVFIHHGDNYKKTIENWSSNFQYSLRSGELAQYGDRFLKVWEFYLAVSKAMFEDSGIGYQVAQIKLQKL